MRTVFADTFCWIAIINVRDPAHARMRALWQSLRPARLVTTDEVLSEVLTYFAGYGPLTRRAAAQMVEALLGSAEVVVLPQSRDSFLSGLTFYKTRPDKEYSLTDCVSMLRMREQGITEVLTNDHHFSQEGFARLIDAP